MIDEVGLESSGTLGIAPYWGSSPPIDSSIHPVTALSGSLPTLLGSQRVLKGSMFKIDLSTARKIDEIQIGRNLSPLTLVSHQGVVSDTTRANHEPGVKEHKHTKSGFSKTASNIAHFVANHKWEILAGAGLCATGFGLAAALGYSLTLAVGGVTVASLGAGAGTGAGIGAGAGAGLGALLDNLKEKPIPKIPRVAPPSSTVDIAIAGQPITSPIPKTDLPSTPNELLVTTDGIWADGQYYSTTDLMKDSLLAEELAKAPSTSPNYYGDATSLLDSQNPFLPNPPIYLGDATKFPDLNEPFLPPGLIPGGGIVGWEGTLPDQWADFDSPAKYAPNSRNLFTGQPTYNESRSRKFTLYGKESSGIHIGWINGVGNSFEDSKNNGSYLQKLGGGYTVCGIYNCSHGWYGAGDFAEAGLLNYQGFSPNTARMLQNDWTAFHEANLNRPNAKILWVCHSQGAIHVKNALEGLPKEIRDRIIVVAIAPAAVVPKRLCYQSFNYASDKDIVYKGETAAAGIGSLTTEGMTLSILETLKDSQELIILKAHPGAKNIDHEFQSLTYKDPILNVLVNYKEHNGEYLPEEKGK